MIKKEESLYYSFFLSAFIMPISIRLGNVFVGISIFIIFYKYKPRTLINKKLYKSIIYTTIVLFLLFFIIFLCEMNVQNFNYIGKRILFLLVPISLFILDKVQINAIKKYSLNGLVFGSFISAIILLSNNFYKIITENEVIEYKNIFNYYHTGQHFTEILDFHPTYLGAYYLFSLIIIMHNPLRSKTNELLVSILLFLTVLTAIIFLNSRIIYFCTSVFIIIFFIQNLIRIYNYKKSHGLITALTSIILLFTLLYTLKDTYIRQRLSSELIWDLTPQVGTNYSGKLKGDSRLARWSSIFRLIKEEPIKGYGMGEEKKAVSNQFLKDGLLYSYNNQYDSHNQYLSFLVQFGFFGIFAILIFLGFNIYLAVSYKDIIYLEFLIIVIGICIFENFLNRNAGIIFVAFFSSVLSRSNYYKSQLPKNYDKISFNK